MATYVISDIHGEYDKLMQILDCIALKEEDTLFVLGDILDRGPHPIQALLQLMKLQNVTFLTGNHEFMALKCLPFLMREGGDVSMEKLNEKQWNDLLLWYANGCKTTIEEFFTLDQGLQQEVVNCLEEFLPYEEIAVDGKKYLLVHAGLRHFSPQKALYEYTMEELVWERPDYNIPYFTDRYVVTGHTPTIVIPDNPDPGCIYRKNTHIDIDCGACYPGGRLAALCLETGEEFYSSSNPID